MSWNVHVRFMQTQPEQKLLPNNWFGFTKNNSMKGLVSWISLNVHVRFNQPNPSKKIKVLDLKRFVHSVFIKDTRANYYQTYENFLIFWNLKIIKYNKLLKRSLHNKQMHRTRQPCAHSVAPSAHATRAGASGEADVVADGTHASRWMACSHSRWWWCQVVQVSVLVLLMMACAPALKVVTLAPVPRATCWQCTTMMLTPTLFYPFRVPLLVAAATAKIVMVGVTHARLHNDAQSDDNDDDSVDVLEAILGHMSVQWVSARTRATTMMGGSV